MSAFVLIAVASCLRMRSILSPVAWKLRSWENVYNSQIGLKEEGILEYENIEKGAVIRINLGFKFLVQYCKSGCLQKFTISKI